MNFSDNWIYLNLEASYHFSLSSVGLASFSLLLGHLWYWRTCSLINFGAQAAALTYLYDVTYVGISFYFYCLHSFQLGKCFCFHTGWIMVIDVYVTSSVKDTCQSSNASILCFALGNVIRSSFFFLPQKQELISCWIEDVIKEYPTSINLNLLHKLC
jgi:hypothetical protein